MKKGTIFILLIIFLVFFGANTIFANIFGLTYSMQKQFGGRILNTKATEINNLESQGYTCNTPGTSILIRPIGSPAGTPNNFLIPSYVTSKTKTTPTSSQLIMGKYNGKTTITCRKPCPPPPGRECIATVTLDNITLFGTSKK